MFVKTELDTNLNEAVSDVELMEYFGVVDDVNPDDESEPDDSDIEREAEDFEPYASQTRGNVSTTCCSLRLRARLQPRLCDGRRGRV